MICFPAYDLHQFFNIVLYKICVVYIYIYTYLCICKDVCMYAFFFIDD